MKSKWLSPILVFVAGITVGGLATSSSAKDKPKPKFENLLRTELESAKGLEVIVSVVEIPPKMTLPKHKHPGEEFAYVLEGSTILMQEGKPDIEIKPGQAGKVPLGQVHSAKTGDEAAKVVVFRVHKKGQPERIPVK